MFKASKKIGTASWAGGGTSYAFVIAGLASTDIALAVIQSSGNSVSVNKAVCTANTLTVTFSGDPGAVVLQYAILRSLD